MWDVAGWTLGARIPKEKLAEVKQSVLYRGLRSEEEWVEKLLKWDLCTDSDFKY